MWQLFTFWVQTSWKLKHIAFCNVLQFAFIVCIIIMLLLLLFIIIIIIIIITNLYCATMSPFEKWIKGSLA